MADFFYDGPGSLGIMRDGDMDTDICRDGDDGIDITVDGEYSMDITQDGDFSMDITLDGEYGEYMPVMIGTSLVTDLGTFDMEEYGWDFTAAQRGL